MKKSVLGHKYGLLPLAILCTLIGVVILGIFLGRTQVRAKQLAEIGILEEAGDWHQARTHLDKMIETFPNDSVVWLERGKCLVSLGMYQEAIDNYTMSRTLDANNPEVYYQLGLVYGAHLGDLDAAEGYFRYAISLKHDYHLAHNKLAYTLRLQGRIDEAIQEYWLSFHRDE